MERYNVEKNLKFESLIEQSSPFTGKTNFKIIFEKKL